MLTLCVFASLLFTLHAYFSHAQLFCSFFAYCSPLLGYTFICMLTSYVFACYFIHISMLTVSFARLLLSCPITVFFVSHVCLLRLCSMLTWSLILVIFVFSCFCIHT